MRRMVLLVVGALAATPTLANDSTAELGAGGLIYVRTDAVAMESEDLYISPSEVRVDYVFRNDTDADVDSIVAFPMPDIDADPYGNVSIPDDASDNFLDFSVIVNGRPMQPALEQRARAAGIDVTADLAAAGIPLFPYAAGMQAKLDALPDATKQDWITRGIIVHDDYDVGKGMEQHYAAVWSLASSYWWRMSFPAGDKVEVSHRYKPSVGGTVAITFLQDGKIQGETLEEYRGKYCMDAGFERAVLKLAAKTPGDMPRYYENWLSYILKTGGNWATSIEKFKLTVDKGSPDNLVSFCGEGVRKVGPTTFEMTAEDFYPERDLDILLILPAGN